VTTIEGTRPLSQPRARPVRGGMSLLEAFRVAIQGLLANKLRSVLTMLGVIIGVGSFIATVAMGQGAAAASRDIIERMGTRVLSVFPASQRRGGISLGQGTAQNFTYEDLEAIQRTIPGIEKIAPQYSGRGRVKYLQYSESTSIVGTTPDYFPIRNVSFLEGGPFTEADVQNRAKVCVLGYEIYAKLFGDQPCLNKVIKINNRNFTVVGLAKPKGAMPFMNMDDMVYIPLDTAMYRVFGVDYLSGASVQSVSEELMSAQQAAIEDLMRQRKRTPPGEEAPVRVYSQGDVLENARQQNAVLSNLLAGIALISLLVGGIGIMNIMLVSVTERTREIGIRKAIGAKNRDILNQFLIESMTLSLLGGLLGVAVGAGFALLMPRFGVPSLLSWPPAMLAFVISAGVGVVFGIYPAMKAARLNPIEALRYE